MPGPLEGIRVLEVATFLAVPQAAALMTDLGAQTIKVESPNGDSWRAFRLDNYGWDDATPTNPMYEIDNRGKQSIAVNLDHPDGRAVVHRLALEADVFLTNLVPARQERYGLSYEALAAINPRLVYLSLSAYGEAGEERDRLGFDYHAYWSRGGILHAMADDTRPPLNPRPGMGDHATAPLLLAGILTALIERERSGLGQRVSTSLLNAGMWANGCDIQGVLITGKAPRREPRRSSVAPLRNTFQGSDGRWFMMGVPEAYWPRFCGLLDRPELEQDPHFRTGRLRSQHREALIALVDPIFATATREEWGRRFDAHGILWAPLQDWLEVIHDPQVRANGYITEVEHPVYGRLETLNTPLKFSRSEVGPKGPAPEAGQHTEEVLLAAGYSWEDIGRLQAAGAVGLA